MAIVLSGLPEASALATMWRQGRHSENQLNSQLFTSFYPELTPVSGGLTMLLQDEAAQDP
ncbi:MAG: hypothetical protein ACLP6G_05695 [Terriglobales bacterium]